jgi:hypothetical protein
MSPLQMGVGVSAGMEKAVHFLRITADQIEDDRGDQDPEMDSDFTNGLASTTSSSSAIPSVSTKQSLGILTVDTSNAYNSISRVAIFDQLVQHFPHLIPVFRWVYGTQTPIFSYHGTKICSSETGVRQGDPLAAFFYCLATHRIEKLVLDSFPAIRMMAYIDDQTFVGPVEDLRRLFDRLVAEMAKIGLVINTNKCHMYTSLRGKNQLLELSPHQESSSSQFQDVQISLEGIKVLGTSLGTVEYVQSVISKRFGAYSSILEFLPHFGSSIAFILAQQCVKSRPLHLMRVTEPWKIETCVKKFDSALTSMVSTLIDPMLQSDIFDTNPASKLVLSLPSKSGGCGLRLGQHIMRAAYTASLFDALDFIHSFHPEAYDIFKASSHGGVTSPPIQQFDPEIIGESIGNGDDMLPNNLSKSYFASGLNKWSAGANGVTNAAGITELREVVGIKISQQNLTSIVDDSLVKSVLNQLQDSGNNRSEYIALFRSNAVDSVTGAWIPCGSFGPAMSRYTLNDRDYSNNLKLRLLLPIYDHEAGIRHCDCNSDTHFDISENHFHFLSCPQAAGHRGNRHTQTNALLREAVKQICGGQCTPGDCWIPNETPNPNGGSLAPVMCRRVSNSNSSADNTTRLRADFGVLINGHYKYVDAGITAPTTVSCRAKAALESLHAAKTYARQKRKKYEDKYLPIVTDKLVTFILETTGALSSDAVKFRDFLFDNRIGTMDSARSHWRWFIRCLSVTYARINSAALISSYGHVRSITLENIIT